MPGLHVPVLVTLQPMASKLEHWLDSKWHQGFKTGMPIEGFVVQLSLSLTYACAFAAANGTKMYETGMPEVDLLSITPEDTTLFTRQIAADNTSMVTNYSSWLPQVSPYKT